MYVVPFQIDAKGYALFVILGQENIEHIEQYDPAVVKMCDLPEQWHRLRLVEVVITYATVEEAQKLMELSFHGKGVEALKLVTRGFRFRPDLGDYDGPALNLTPKPGENKQ